MPEYVPELLRLLLPWQNILAAVFVGLVYLAIMYVLWKKGIE